MKLNLKGLEKQLLQIENEQVTVGILNKSTRSAKPNWSKGMGSLSNGAQSTPKRYVLSKGRNKNIELHKLAKILDSKKGIISNAMSKASNKEVVKVAQEFAVLDKTPKDIKRLENAARDIVRNPILRKDYNPNAPSYVKRKGFNHWGFLTGTFFKNIKAVFKRGN